MKISQFADKIKNGEAFKVKFKNKIDDIESYFDPNMIANAVNVGEVYDCNVFEIIFEFKEFEKHNDMVEKCDYFDKTGNACLSSKEAGFFPTNFKESIYFDGEEDIEDYLEIINKNNTIFNLPNNQITTDQSLAAKEWEEAFYTMKSALERIKDIPIKILLRQKVACLDEIIAECENALKLGKRDY